MDISLNLTVITICFDNLEELLITCRSVDDQSRKPFEHLVIDGSTDSAIRLYLENNPQPSYRKWISERDKGIADAFNKGVGNSRGNILVMLNSGDGFFDANSLNIALNAFKDQPGISWLHGKYKLSRGDQWVIIGKPFEKKKLYRGMRSICHQSLFIRKSLHDKHGLYNTDEKIAMDYDFLCRISDEPFVFLNTPLIRFAPGGISSANYLQSLRESKKVYERHFGKSFRLALWQVRLRILFRLLQSPAGNFLYKIKAGMKAENL
ncbi:MAG: glycosyltransferase [Ferruginibacter sp.]